MRASASSCICRLATPQRAVSPPTLRIASSTSSRLLFPTSFNAGSSSKQQQQQRQQQRHASSKGGQSNEADRTANEAGEAALHPDAPAASAASVKAKGLEQWLKSEDGQRYKRPLTGRSNWIGRTVRRLLLSCKASYEYLLTLNVVCLQPFPLNPSFRPPTSLSHNAKEKIYRDFIASYKQTQSSSSNGEAKSETYHARKIALKYNLSIDRVRAIVRLKALEYNTAAAGSTLQMKFLNGMESAMGISTGDNVPISMKEALDVQQETEALYKTGRKTHWMMINEENPNDLKDEVKELEKKQRKDERANARRQGGDDISRDLREGVRSRRRVPANPRSERKGVRPEIEFVDVPGTISK